MREMKIFLIQKYVNCRSFKKIIVVDLFDIKARVVIIIIQFVTVVDFLP